MIDEILSKFHVKYEDLSAIEKETLNSLLNAVQTQTLTTEKIKEAIGTMKRSVENELTDLIKNNHSKEQDIFLKARLRNFMLLEDMLSGPDKAKRALEIAIANLAR